MTVQESTSDVVSSSKMADAHTKVVVAALRLVGVLPDSILLLKQSAQPSALHMINRGEVMTPDAIFELFNLFVGIGEQLLIGVGLLVGSTQQSGLFFGFLAHHLVGLIKVTLERIEGVSDGVGIG